MMILSQVFVVAALLPKCLFKEEVWKVWPKRVVEIIVSTRKELASNAGHNANFGLGWRPVASSRKNSEKNGLGPFSTVKVCAIM